MVVVTTLLSFSVSQLLNILSLSTFSASQLRAPPQYRFGLSDVAGDRKLGLNLEKSGLAWDGTKNPSRLCFDTRLYPYHTLSDLSHRQHHSSLSIYLSTHS